LANQIIPEKVSPEKVVDDTELQELRAKVRVLEAKRADDARHVRELETRLSEAESFVALRPKLQAKLNSQQTELIATRRELADSKQLAELSEARVVDAQEQLEMAMLDKEVAEERAEIAESELDDLRERLAIAEVELEVMKEGGEEIDEGGESNAKSSLAYIQLEKQNERLKEALIRSVQCSLRLTRYADLWGTIDFAT
jgi:dynactin 1